MKKKKPEQPKLDIDLGQACFPPTGLGEGKTGVLTEELELVKQRKLIKEKKKQREMFKDKGKE